VQNVYLKSAPVVASNKLSLSLARLQFNLPPLLQLQLILVLRSRSFTILGDRNFGAVSDSGMSAYVFESFLDMLNSIQRFTFCRLSQVSLPP
jgi:hypothetical protein